MVEIIPANSINYKNVDEICAYRSLLCKIYECEGGFNLQAKYTPTTREIAQQSLVWLREAKALIESILRGGVAYANLGDIPRLLQSYDFFYRIGNGAPCYDYIREVKLKTVDCRVKGDKSISQTEVVLLLLSEADRDIRNLEERYAKYALTVMSKWVDELVECAEFKDTPKSETYRRLSYLIDTDLSTHFGRKEEAKIKAQWISTHILADEQIDAADTETLWAYSTFIDSLPSRNQKEYEHHNLMYMHILSILASRPDVHPYLVKAIELTFKRQKALIA